MNVFPRTFTILAALLFAPADAAERQPAIEAIAALTDPAKLATLTGERAANDRLHKIMAWLEDGHPAPRSSTARGSRFSFSSHPVACPHERDHF